MQRIHRRRTSRVDSALVAYLDRLEDAGVAHVLMNIARGPRDAREIVEELGREVLPRLKSAAA